MSNLIKNPNITSSHLFRADILYDSQTDPTYAPLYNLEQWDRREAELSNFSKHMKPCYRPRPLRLQAWGMTRTVVRELIPRNPQLDRRLAQTCCFYERDREAHDNHEQVAHVGDSREDDVLCGRHNEDSRLNTEASTSMLVIYIPHVQSANEIPFYHPPVQALAFLYEWHLASPIAPSSENNVGQLSLHTAHFPPTTSTTPSNNNTQRLQRTLTNLTRTIHRHGTGLLHGYQKRVHHDLVVPQARFQDTYTRLKLSYASRITQTWREVTDPTKHVFEDLGIAAWLIEVWQDMYGIEPEAGSEAKAEQARRGGFAGFVDVGCGNGLLVALLSWEGYNGWGFDVRRRRSWEEYECDERVQGRLQERILTPAVFPSQPEDSTQTPTHDGIFTLGTFIVSNHADELTPWTPLLASLSHSPFLAIPCCSHSLTGARTRFPPQKKPHDDKDATRNPSAYQTLCDYTERLTTSVGYTARREHLRIPSTRNVGILGLPSFFTWAKDDGGEGGSCAESGLVDVEKRLETIRGVVEREVTGLSVANVGREWWARVEKLTKGKGTGSGH